jgi:pilus assembly protein Flp/PilA
VVHARAPGPEIATFFFETELRSPTQRWVLGPTQLHRAVGGKGMNALKRLWKDEEAANAVEYGLIAAIIAVGLILAFRRFGGQISSLFDRQGSKISNE